MELVKQTFLETQEYKFEYEVVGDVLVLHLEVTKWSHNILKVMRGVFELFTQNAKDQGFSKLVTFTPNPSFCRLFGGTYKDHMMVNGEYIEVIQWELKQP